MKPHEVETSHHLRDVDSVAQMTREQLELHAKALRTINAIMDAILTAGDPCELPQRAVDAVAQFTHFPAVAIFDLDEEAGELVIVGSRGFTDHTLRAGSRLPLYGSFTGYAVRSRKLVTSDDVSQDPRTEPMVREHLAADGLSGIASMPLIAGGRIAGAMNLIYRGALGLSADERKLIQSIGRVIACNIERTRSVRRLETEIAHRKRDEEWRAFLSNASVVLASSLDYESTLSQVAHLAAGTLADCCVIDIVQGDGSIRRVAGAHADAAKQPLVDTLVRSARLDPNAKSGVAAAIRDGRTILLTNVSEEQLSPGPDVAVSSSDPEHLRLVRALGVENFLSVPLRVRDRTFGALSLAARDSRRFGPVDVTHAEELAYRCAMAIDNARLYREACDAIAVRDEFMSIASHELKTPVQALELALTSIERERVAERPLGPQLARARTSLVRLTKLVESLLDVTRLASGRVALAREDVDLGALVSEIADRFREEARRSGCTISVRAEPVHGQWDKLKIDQAVSNLVVNAIKYGRAKPIEIEVDRCNGDARVSVTDHGIGIAKENVARVFERFERAVSARNYGGLGLGLYIARGIVEAHGGTIQVASKVGEGSTFTIILPTKPA